MPLNIYGLTASSINNSSHIVTSTDHSGLTGKEKGQDPLPHPLDVPEPKVDRWGATCLVWITL